MMLFMTDITLEMQEDNNLTVRTNIELFIINNNSYEYLMLQ